LRLGAFFSHCETYVKLKHVNVRSREI